MGDDKKRILIVEDQTDVRKLIELALKNKDRAIWEAGDGEGAIAIAREVNPHLIILDVMLPGELDGYDVARTLRRDLETSKISIIIMTAKVQKQDRIDAFDAGADDYIGKPFNLAELQEKTSKYLS